MSSDSFKFNRYYQCSLFSDSFHIKDLKVAGLSGLRVVWTEYDPVSMEFKAFFIAPNLHVKSYFSWSTYYTHITTRILEKTSTVNNNIDAGLKLPEEKFGLSFEFSKDPDTKKWTTKNFKLYEPQFDWDRYLSRSLTLLGVYNDKIKNELKLVISEIDGDLQKMATEYIKEIVNKVIADYKDVDHDIKDFFKCGPCVTNCNL